MQENEECWNNSSCEELPIQMGFDAITRFGSDQ